MQLADEMPRLVTRFGAMWLAHGVVIYPIAQHRWSSSSKDLAEKPAQVARTEGPWEAHLVLGRTLFFAAGLLLSACGLLTGIDAIHVESDTGGPSAPEDGAPDVYAGDTEVPSRPGAEDASPPPADAVDAADGNVRTTRRVFVTAAEFLGNLGGTQGADAKCEAAAKAAGLGDGRWRAWLGVAGAATSDRIEFDGPYERMDGKPVVASKALLNGAALENPIALTESGAAPEGANERVWTGTRPTGQVANFNCGDWAVEGTFGESGLFARTNGDWTDDGALPIHCGQLARLYCFES